MVSSLHPQAEVAVTLPTTLAWTAVERRWRDDLLIATIGSPASLPAPADVNLDDQWARFDASAPGHLAIGLRLAVWVLAAALPVVRHGRTLAGLDAKKRDAVLVDAAELPLVRELVDVAKVACNLVYFAHPAVQAAARRHL